MSVSDEVDEVEGAHEEITPTLADAVQNADRPLSVIEILRRNHEEAKQRQKLKELKIPGYGGPGDSSLYATFHMVDDYEGARERIVRTMRRRGLSAARRDVLLALGTLAMAAEGSYAFVDGQQHDIGKPLGLELYRELFPRQDGQVAYPSNDEEAIMLLFESNQLLVVRYASEIDMWIQRGGEDAEEDVLGE